MQSIHRAGPPASRWMTILDKSRSSDAPRLPNLFGYFQSRRRAGLPAPLGMKTAGLGRRPARAVRWAIFKTAAPLPASLVGLSWIWLAGASVLCPASAWDGHVSGWGLHRSLPAVPHVPTQRVAGRAASALESFHIFRAPLPGRHPGRRVLPTRQPGAGADPSLWHRRGPPLYASDRGIDPLYPGRLLHLPAGLRIDAPLAARVPGGRYLCAFRLPDRLSSLTIGCAAHGDLAAAGALAVAASLSTAGALALVDRRGVCVCRRLPRRPSSNLSPPELRCAGLGRSVAHSRTPLAVATDADPRLRWRVSPCSTPYS